MPGPNNFGFKKNSSGGFSLIEMVVAVTIFIFVILMITSVFQNSIITQKNSVATQNVQEAIRYAMEVMSKETRSAIANIDPTATSTQCSFDGVDMNGLSPSGKRYHEVYNVSDSGVFYFRNKDGACVYYLLEGNALKIDRNGVRLPLTPAAVKVSSFKVDIQDNNTDYVGDFHSTQPNVTIVMDMVSEKDENSEMKLQTTISSRYYK